METNDFQRVPAFPAIREAQDLAAQDLATQPMPGRSIAPPANTSDVRQNNDFIPKMKRIACVLCRKRKLRCEGSRPSCATCVRLGHDCHYDEVRRKSGPQRGYVKRLEARLAQVETMLKTTQESPEEVQDGAAATDDYDFPTQQMEGVSTDSDPTGLNDVTGSVTFLEMPISFDSANVEMSNQNQSFTTFIPPPHPVDESSFSFDLISLGLEEPLPSQDIIRDL